MFDVFDIQLPELLPVPGFEVRRHESAFGMSDEEFLFVDGVAFGRVVAASVAYSDVEAWTGSFGRHGWTVLLVGRTADDAAATDESWGAFLKSLDSLLGAHSVWRVICESDCDQHQLKRVRLSPAAFTELLDSVRRQHSLPIAFEATSP